MPAKKAAAKKAPAKKKAAAKIAPVERVVITHPQIELPAIVSQAAFTKVYEARGWVLSDMPIADAQQLKAIDIPDRPNTTESKE